MVLNFLKLVLKQYGILFKKMCGNPAYPKSSQKAVT